MAVFVAILGVGGVGKCFLQQLEGLLQRQPALGITVCYVAKSAKALYSDRYGAIALATALEQLGGSSSSSSGRKPFAIGSELLDYLAAAPGPVVLVDNTSSQDVAEIYPQALRKRIHIVTPNKKAFSGELALWRDIQAAAASTGACVLHEATVGAGLPVISTINDLVETGDSIVTIEGVLSGTLSYLCNAFCPLDPTTNAAGAVTWWSDAVNTAKQLGYTEPDPRDDLNGLDVARKLTILARLAGLPVQSATSFPVESLIPAELESCASGAEFLQRLPHSDRHMNDLRESAASQGKLLRYVGRIDVAKSKLSVELQRCAKTHPMAALTGTDNCISIYTCRYGANPLIIQGAGAGGEVTAMGVLADLLKILRTLGHAKS